MRRLTVLPLILIAFIANAQLGAKANQSNKLTGIWQNDQFGYQMTLMLNPDGTGEFDGEEIRYVVKGNVLALTAQNETTNYNYILNGTQLTVSGGDLDQAVTFSKAGSSQSNQQPANNISAQQQTQTVTAGAGIDKALLGAWSGNNETMEFKPDGTCIYAGHSIPFTASNGQIKLTSQQGTTVIPYTIKNGQLVINVNGQDYTYTRGTAQASNKPVSSGPKSVPQELAGEWCVMNSTNTNSGGSFSSECLTLYPDGTYVYSTERSMSVNTPDLAGGTSSQGGDRGQWWTEGERFFFNSPTYGTGSYRLEKRNHPKNVNDPMIVLDGKAYVTTKLKAPWR
jgi:hypothetical protein